jgi:hypothetical protein
MSSKAKSISWDSPFNTRFEETCDWAKYFAKWPFIPWLLTVFYVQLYWMTRLMYCTFNNQKTLPIKKFFSWCFFPCSNHRIIENMVSFHSFLKNWKQCFRLSQWFSFSSSTVVQFIEGVFNNLEISITSSYSIFVAIKDFTEFLSRKITTFWNNCAEKGLSKSPFFRKWLRIKFAKPNTYGSLCSYLQRT